MFDLVRLAMNRACVIYGVDDKRIFNAACFSQAFTALAGIATPLDGRLVEAILCGRPDVEQLHGNEHYRLITHV